MFYSYESKKKLIVKKITEPITEPIPKPIQQIVKMIFQTIDAKPKEASSLHLLEDYSTKIQPYNPKATKYLNSLIKKITKNRLADRSSQNAIFQLLCHF